MFRRWGPGLLAILLSLAVPMGAPVPAQELSGEFEARPPILIDGDGDFTLANGVRSGTGSASDPYVIEGWEILAGEAAFDPSGRNRGSIHTWELGGGIRVQNVTASFVIRDVFVHSGLDRMGIAVHRAQSGDVSNVVVDDTEYGIMVAFSSDVTVSGSDVTGVWDRGIWVERSSRVVVQQNEVRDSGSSGIDVRRSSDILVEDNRVTEARNVGVYLHDTSASMVRSNVLHRTGGGWFEAGLGIHNSTGIRIYGNDFVDNVVHASAESDDNNSWDGGYPEGGNYWSGYTGEDRCSGPDQLDCEAGDGIVDRPYVIDANSIDRYPLQTPNHPEYAPESSALPVVPLLASAVAVAVGVLVVTLWRRRRRDQAG